MSETDILDIGRESIVVMIRLGGPIMIVALVIGLIISLFQALTQIQEATLSFVPKVLAVFATLILLMPYMLSTLITYTQGLADRIVGLGAG